MLQKCTWTALQFQSGLDRRYSGDDGSIRHDGSVHVDFFGGGERGARWWAEFLSFHIEQLSGLSKKFSNSFRNYLCAENQRKGICGETFLKNVRNVLSHSVRCKIMKGLEKGANATC